MNEDTRTNRPGSADQQLSPPAPIAEETESAGEQDFAPGIETAFPRDFRESCREVPCVHGAIPKFVRGTYYLNGPAKFAAGHLSYQHWLDGDGMISALDFDGSRIRFTNRYVRSTKYDVEQQAGRAVFRSFGTAFTGDRLNRVSNGVESPVNVSVYRFGGNLLAFGEQGLPWALDPYTLETRGQFTFDGRLNDASPFSAHPKFDSDTHEMFNFGVFFSTVAPRLYLYCFGREGLRYRKAVPLEYPCSVHDFSISKHYAIFYLSPYVLEVEYLLRGGSTVLDALRWLPERGSRLVILDRNSGEMVASLPLGRRYCLHLMNSFEQDGFLVVDFLEFDSPIYPEYQPVPDLFQSVASGGPVRLTIDLDKKEIADRRQLDPVYAPDFPAIDPGQAMQAYEDYWMLGISHAGKPGRKFFDQLIHGSWNGRSADIYQARPMCYLGGEPVVICAPDSNEAVVLCQEYDASERTSSFLLFDARNVKPGPIAKIAVGQPLYLGFHAIFCSQL